MIKNKHNTEDNFLQIPEKLFYLPKKELFILGLITRFERTSKLGKFYMKDQAIADKWCEITGNEASRSYMNKAIKSLCDKNLIVIKNPNTHRRELIRLYKKTTRLYKKTTEVVQKGTRRLYKKTTEVVQKGTHNNKIKIRTLNKNIKIIPPKAPQGAKSKYEKLVIYFEENRLSGRKFKGTHRLKQLKAAQKLLDSYSKKEVYETLIVIFLAMQKKWAGKFKYCPRISTLEQLSQGTAFERTQSFIISTIGENQTSQVAEI